LLNGCVFQTTVEAEWTTVLSRHMFEFRANELGNVYNHAFEPSLIPFSPETRSSQQVCTHLRSTLQLYSHARSAPLKRYVLS